jgi:hypothetical protein
MCVFHQPIAQGIVGVGVVVTGRTAALLAGQAIRCIVRPGHAVTSRFQYAGAIAPRRRSRPRTRQSACRHFPEYTAPPRSRQHGIRGWPMKHRRTCPGQANGGQANGNEIWTTDVRQALPIRRRQIFLRAENHSLAQYSLARLPHWVTPMDSPKRGGWNDRKHFLPLNGPPVPSKSQIQSQIDSGEAIGCRPPSAARIAEIRLSMVVDSQPGMPAF